MPSTLYSCRWGNQSWERPQVKEGLHWTWDDLNMSIWFLNISSYLQASFSLRMSFINKREESMLLSHMHDRHHSATWVGSRLLLKLVLLVFDNRLLANNNSQQHQLLCSKSPYPTESASEFCPLPLHFYPVAVHASSPMPPPSPAWTAAVDFGLVFLFLFLLHYCLVFKLHSE